MAEPPQALEICSPSTSPPEARETLPASIRLAARHSLQPVTDGVPWALIRNWAAAETTAIWHRQLSESAPWQQPVVQVYGRKHPVPRLTAFLAEEGLRYRYSGTQHTGSGWPAWFIPLLEMVRQTSSCPFNGCLLNLYRHGDDRMGWHADDEPEIDQQSPIASLSIGATRDFQLRHRRNHDQKVSLKLADGDLLIMQPGCQQNWQHCVPQRKRVQTCLLYTSPSPRDLSTSRMPSSA